MNTHAKHHLFFRAIFFLVAFLLLAGCAFTSKPLTTSGVDSEPHIVWNGSHFGIVYYHSSASGALPQINLVKVDKNVNIIAAKTGVGSIPHLYSPFLLSDLVLS